MIDTHCHLTFPDFEGIVDDVLARARDKGVTGVISVSTTPADARKTLALARGHENVWCTAGAHPLYADEAPFDWDALLGVARAEECVAWGEMGLDNHYDKPPRAAQDAVLEGALALVERAKGKGVDKPVVLHCREAFADLVPILKKSAVDPQRFVFHCFTGTPGDMRTLLDFGAFVSFTGIVTYRNARAVQEAARLAPLDRIMVETDAPFLTPEPHRRVRPNEPRYVEATALFLAGLRGEKWGVFHDAINENTCRFYGVPS